ncbi:MAG: hypothetical protein U1F43_21970 [Myxococcota bacterium]
MKVWQVVARAETPEGLPLVLSRSGDDFLIRVNGRGLMASDQHGSEEALAARGCERARALAAPTVLVGGLGMGFTLRAALDALPPGARVVVAELLPAVVAWNRGPLAELAGRPLDDVRVEVVEGDVAALLEARAGAFDAILMDVDNGPVAMVEETNAGLYDARGLARARRALRPGGRLVVWSAGPDARFVARLRAAGFEAAAEVVKATPGRGARDHTLFVALRPDDAQRA